MSAELGVCKVAAERVHLPPMTAGATFDWDGIGTVSRSIGPHMGTGRHPRPSLTAGDPCLAALISTTGPRLGTRGAMPDRLPRSGAPPGYRMRRGLRSDRRAHVGTAGKGMPSSSPSMCTPCCSSMPPTNHSRRIASRWCRTCALAIPCSTTSRWSCRPQIDAETLASRLYAESLTNALAVHLLRRYAACRPPAVAWIGGSLQAQATAHDRVYRGASGARVLVDRDRGRGADESCPLCASVQASDRSDAPPISHHAPDRACEALADGERVAHHRHQPPGRLHGSKLLHRGVSEACRHNPQSLPRRYPTVVPSSMCCRVFSPCARLPIAEMASGPLRPHHRTISPSWLSSPLS